MLLHEYRIRDEFDRLKVYALSIREKFDAEASVDDLLRDANSLEVLYKILADALPPEVSQQSSILRHLGFMQYWLRQGSRTG